MRIFVGTEEISGYYANLAAGFRRLGIAADYCVWVNHRFSYTVDVPPNQLFQATRVLRNLVRQLKKKGTPFPALLRRAQQYLCRLFLCWASQHYDAFIFGFGGAIGTLTVDLPLLRSLGKKIVLVYNGSDARPPFIGVPAVKSTSAADIVKVIKATAATKNRLTFAEKHATAVVAQVETAHFLEKPFVPFMFVGIPVKDNATVGFSPSRQSNGSVRILHCPSRTLDKGTAEIRHAINVLKMGGHSIDYVEIINRPNSQVLKELAHCDFVVDQLYSDTPLAGFATEAASFGKPAVVGSYAVQHVRSVYPSEIIPPSHFCCPGQIVPAIEKLIVDPNHRLELGRRAREFVRTYWRPECVAERVLKLIKGQTPNDWLYDPRQVRYLHGVGMSKHRVKRTIQAMLNTGGQDSLQLSDKPELEQAFVDFAETERMQETEADPY